MTRSWPSMDHPQVGTIGPETRLLGGAGETWQPLRRLASLWILRGRREAVKQFEGLEQAPRRRAANGSERSFAAKSLDTVALRARPFGVATCNYGASWDNYGPVSWISMELGRAHESLCLRTLRMS